MIQSNKNLKRDSLRLAFALVGISFLNCHFNAIPPEDAILNKVQNKVVFNLKTSHKEKSVYIQWYAEKHGMIAYSNLVKTDVDGRLVYTLKIATDSFSALLFIDTNQDQLLDSNDVGKVYENLSLTTQSVNRVRYLNLNVNDADLMALQSVSHTIATGKLANTNYHCMFTLASVPYFTTNSNTDNNNDANYAFNHWKPYATWKTDGSGNYGTAIVQAAVVPNINYKSRCITDVNQNNIYDGSDGATDVININGAAPDLNF